MRRGKYRGDRRAFSFGYLQKRDGNTPPLRIPRRPGFIGKAAQKNNIRYEFDSEITELAGEQGLQKITVLNKRTGESRDISVEALFVAIGFLPQNDVCKNTAELDDGGFIKAGEDCVTSCSGIFAAGDCRTKALRQLTTAAADGAAAAYAACKFIG